MTLYSMEIGMDVTEKTAMITPARTPVTEQYHPIILNKTTRSID